MLKTGAIAFIAILFSAFLGAAVVFGQTPTEIPTPTTMPTTSPTPSPTTSVPSGAPATGLGG